MSGFLFYVRIAFVPEAWQKKLEPMISSHRNRLITNLRHYVRYILKNNSMYNIDTYTYISDYIYTRMHKFIDYDFVIVCVKSKWLPYYIKIQHINLQGVSISYDNLHHAHLCHPYSRWSSGWLLHTIPDLLLLHTDLHYHRGTTSNKGEHDVTTEENLLELGASMTSDSLHLFRQYHPYIPG